MPFHPEVLVTWTSSFLHATCGNNRPRPRRTTRTDWAHKRIAKAKRRRKKGYAA